MLRGTSLPNLSDFLVARIESALRFRCRSVTLFPHSPLPLPVKRRALLIPPSHLSQVCHVVLSYIPLTYSAASMARDDSCNTDQVFVTHLLRFAFNLRELDHTPQHVALPR